MHIRSDNDQQDTAPSAPVITTRQIVEQFLVDISGKEVQEAASYSYLWLAIQVAHSGLLIAFHLILVRAVQFFAPMFSSGAANLISLASLLLITAVWEVFSYRRVVRDSSENHFPVNRGDVAKNAVIATVYMWIGALMGFVSQLDSSGLAAGLFFLLIVLFIVLAFPWLREKIIWQKAALPYVSRLATARDTIDETSAETIAAFVAGPLPPDAPPRHIVVFGEVGTGRTQLVAAIGTELAFRGMRVRYLGFDKLQALINKNANDPGPRNINYWPWQASQVLIIDDVGDSLEPVGMMAGQGSRAQLFRSMMCTPNPSVANQLGERCTIWVAGDEAATCNEWIQAVKAACNATEDPVAIVLSRPPQAAGVS